MVTLLSFDVINQTLKRVDRFSPATDSVDYLKAVFNFKTDDWSDKTKYALFRLGTKTYAEALDNKNTCKVPYEVLKATDESKASIGAKNKVFVTLVGEKGTVRVPTNALRVDLETSGYADAENGADPTPDLYAQYIAEVKAAVAEHAANAENSMNIANEKAAEASESAASLKNDYSNALKGVASGAVVRVDDVSPVEHLPVVKVHGKNLIPYPFSVDTHTINGITYTNNGDGSFTLNGTSTANFAIVFLTNINLTLNGVYTFSMGNKFDGAGGLYLKNANGETVMFVASRKTSTTASVSDTITRFDMWINAGKTFDNFTVYPQLEKGTTATEYAPYVDPSTVAVTRCGKNILKPTITDKTVAGLNFTVDKDGKITINGTATSTTYTPVGSVNLKAGKTYILSGCPLGGNSSTYRLDLRNTNTSLYEPNVFDYGDGVMFTPEEDVTLVVGLRYAIGAVISNVHFSPMIQVANNADILFEAYNGEEYTPSTDGTINGLTSVSPTMTLLTDTEGVTVECEYNQDANKVFERLKNAIIALGGVV